MYLFQLLYPSFVSEMDPETLMSIMRPTVRDIGHGVRLCRADSIESKTLVAYVATGGSVRIGYAYRNGSNTTVMCSTLQGDVKKTTPPVGTLLLNFTDQRTNRSPDQLTGEDFLIPWLTQEHHRLIWTELGAQLGEWQDAFDDVIDSFIDLPVQSLRKIQAYVESGLPDTIQRAKVVTGC